MKQLIVIISAICLFTFNVKAQHGIPYKSLNYQAIIRDNAGAVLPNQFISMRLGIYQDTLPAAILPAYQEVHVVKTNAFGMVNLLIGKGASTRGNYDTLDWSHKYRYLKVELDADGGTVFKKMGYSQFQTTPYAQVALDVINKPTMTLDELQDVNTTGATSGQVLKFNGTTWTPATDNTASAGGGGVAVGTTLTGNGTAATPLNLAQQGATPGQYMKWNGLSWVPADAPSGGATYSAGTGIIISGSTISNAGDLSNTNEIQTISLTGNTLNLSNGGGSVTLPSGGATYTAGAGIDISGNVIKNIGDTNAADDLTTSSSANGDVLGAFNDLKVVKIYNFPVNPTAPTLNQVLKWDGTAWKPSTDATGGGGGGTDSQILSVAGNQLSISNGNTVTLPTGTTYTAGTGISIAGNAISATDNSATNEIQSLSLAGNTLSLSNGGGSVTLPSGGGGGGSLNGTGTAGSLARWTTSTTLGDAAIQQDIESNLGVNTIPQTAYKMRIKSTVASQRPLEILGNNVPGAGIQFTLNDAAQNAEINVQSAVTNFRTTSDKLALNARSASALPLMADHLQIRNNGSVMMGLFDPMSSSDLLSVRGNIGIKDGSYNFYDNSNAATADISCISPTNKLHIHSIATNAGMELISTGGKIELATNGIGGATSEMKIENGKVTIGSGAGAQPKLEVAGQVKITGGTPGAGKVLTSDATGLATWENSPVLGSQWSTAGIGIENANQTSSVHIKSSATEPLRIEGGSGMYASIYESGNYRGYFGSFSGAAADVDFGTGSGSAAKTHLVTNATPRLTVDAAGSIGIGTQTPFTQLHVNSNAPLTESGMLFTHQGTGTSIADGTRIRMNSDNFLISNQEAGHISLGTSNNNNRIILENNGNVGIGTGTLTNTEKLTIKEGRILFTGITTPNNTVGVMEFATGTKFSFGGGLQSNVDNFDALGGSARRWTTLYASNGTINTSDRREKTNIKSLNYGLKEVMSLKPVTYEWKNRREQGAKIGFIAQDLQETLPEVVSDKEWVRGEDGKLKSQDAARLGVYYSDIIPVLTKAIQEQQAMIEALQKEVAALKKQ